MGVSMSLVAHRVRAVMARVLSLAPESIDATTSFWDNDSWNSLRHVELIEALEQEFGIWLEGADAAAMLDFDSICHRLATAAEDVPQAGTAPREVSRDALVAQVARLPLPPGGVLLMHASLAAVGPVERGPVTVIDALVQALRRVGGTLVMPAMAGRSRLGYDPARTPTNDMGVLAEVFWRMPGVLRSSHPTSAFAALGPAAGWLLERHPIDRPEGPAGPMGRMAERDARVLLLGTGHMANTSIHLAEYLEHVGYQTRQPISRRAPDAHGTLICISHCSRGFERLGPALQRSGRIQRWQLGRAEAQLFAMSAAVDLARRMLADDPCVFLCEMGVCSQCDEAREASHAMTDLDAEVLRSGDPEPRRRARRMPHADRQRR